MYEKRIHVRRSGWRSHEEERQHEARIMHRGCIYIYRGKNSSLFTNWNNSILHARDLSRLCHEIYIHIRGYSSTYARVPILSRLVSTTKKIFISSTRTMYNLFLRNFYLRHLCSPLSFLYFPYCTAYRFIKLNGRGSTKKKTDFQINDFPHTRDPS